MTGEEARAFLARLKGVPAAAIALVAGALLVLAAMLLTRGSGDEPAPAGATSSLAVAVPVGGGPEGAVSVTALEPVWIKVYEDEQPTPLFMGELAPGQSYQLPADVDDPMLWTGRPHAVEVRLGETLLPVLGPPGQPLKDISLDRTALRARIPPPPPLPPVKG